VPVSEVELKLCWLVRPTGVNVVSGESIMLPTTTQDPGTVVTIAEVLVTEEAPLCKAMAPTAPAPASTTVVRSSRAAVVTPALVAVTVMDPGAAA
jgi:hypothetical protein